MAGNAEEICEMLENNYLKLRARSALACHVVNFSCHVHYILELLLHASPSRLTT
jgi:hypothetical protein